MLTSDINYHRLADCTYREHTHSVLVYQLDAIKSHGYLVKEYQVPLHDGYVLTVHRLIHPEDRQVAKNGGRTYPRKKPYLLVHGLIGTSASFLTNVDDNYEAPPKSYYPWKDIDDKLNQMRDTYKFHWESTAAKHHKTSGPEDPGKFWYKKGRKYASSIELGFNADYMEFERAFRQAYNKFYFEKQALGNTTSSLAFTLSNFGNDVWLVNLRGNDYSSYYNGPKIPQRSDYWDFNIESIIQEDLAATLAFMQEELRLDDGNEIGMVTYSYSSAYALGLMTKFPNLQKKLRPVIMIAPTLLTGTPGLKINSIALRAINFLISRNGPIPVLEEATAHDSPLTSFMKYTCSTKIFTKLCNIMFQVILGEIDKLRSLGSMVRSSREDRLLSRDIRCGRTSRAILHQIINNLSQYNILPQFQPYIAGRVLRSPQRGKERPNRASVMLIHARNDRISTMDEVERIRNGALQTLTLADYVVEEPDFSHTDFLFSRKNEYLVNAEVARFVVVHDYLLHYRPLKETWGKGPVRF